MSKNDLVDADVVDTRVGNAILVKGDIEGDGNVIVEGRVEGKIAIKGDLHVAADGQVKSTVSARNIFVQGILVGAATAVDKIEIAAGGRMVGDVRTPRFLINEGAAYKGTVDMVGFEPGEPGAEQPRPGRQPTPTRRTQASSTMATPVEGTREPVARPTPRASSSSQTSSGYASQVVRPPEFVGVKKAIIIKKKSEDTL